MASRLALLLTGIWLGALVFSWAVATLNFRTVDRVLDTSPRPELERTLGPLSPPERWMAFRHLAAEINRGLFGGFGVAQLVAGAALLYLSWGVGGWARPVALLALGLVFLQVAIGIPITSLGRAIDFVPRPLPAALGQRFGMLHGAFAVLDLAKAGLLITQAVLLTRR